MHDMNPRAEVQVANPPVRTLALAVLAPFAMIALMASPIFVDVVRRAFGV